MMTSVPTLQNSAQTPHCGIRPEAPGPGITEFAQVFKLTDPGKLTLCQKSAADSVGMLLPVSRLPVTKFNTADDDAEDGPLLPAASNADSVLPLFLPAPALFSTGISPAEIKLTAATLAPQNKPATDTRLGEPVLLSLTAQPQAITDARLSPAMLMPDMSPQQRDDTFLHQIVQALGSENTNTQNEIRFRLHPKSLGDMTVRILIEPTGTVVSVSVDNPRTLDIFQPLMPRLERHLDMQGDKPVRAVLNMETGGHASSSHQQPPATPDRPDRQLKPPRKPAAQASPSRIRRHELTERVA
jgi:hypothetical protein